MPSIIFLVMGLHIEEKGEFISMKRLNKQCKPTSPNFFAQNFGLQISSILRIRRLKGFSQERKM
jgi:hypothetical protein